MNIFDVPEALYFCSAFRNSSGAPEGSIRDYVSSNLSSTKSLREGTPAFDAFRDCCLRDAERKLFLAISQYARSLDLMMPGAASWAQVTIYYGSFYAASALLGMFGGWVGPRKTVIEVAASTPGSQELAIDRKAYSSYNGSHQRFWDFFYRAATKLVPWVDPALRVGIVPVSSDPSWQIDSRNTVNYDAFAAFQLMAGFRSSFRAKGFPATLPGTLNTQFVVFEGLLHVVCDFAKQNGLQTDALDVLWPGLTRRQRIRNLVFDARPPSFAKRVKRRRVIV